MTLVTGTVQDLGYDGVEGTLWARPARFRSDGQVVYAPERKPYKVVDGVVSADLAPGPAVLELQVGSHARGTFEVVIPEADTTLADLLDTVFPWEPAQVSLFVAEREAAERAKSDAETAAGQASTAAGTATAAAQQTGQDRARVDQVRTELDEAYDASEAGQALPPRLTEAALNATYASLSHRPINMRDQPGVDPTGATECGDAIRAALLLSDKIEWGLPGDIYLAGQQGSNAWAFPLHDGQSWQGNGATLKLAPGQAPFTCVAWTRGNNWRIDDLTLDGSRASQSVETQFTRHGLSMDNTTGGRMSRVDIRDTAGDCINGWRQVWDIVIRDVNVFNSDRAGIALTGSGGDILMDRVRGYDVTTQAFDAEVDTGLYTRVTSRDCYWKHGPTDYAIDLTGKNIDINSIRFIDTDIVGGVHLSHAKDILFIGGSIDATSGTKRPVTTTFGMDGLRMDRTTITGKATDRGISMEVTGAPVADRLDLRGVTFNMGTGAAVKASGVRRIWAEGCRTFGTGGGYAAFDITANQAMRNLAIRNCETYGYARNVYVNATSLISRLVLENNHLDDGIAGSLYGVQLVGTATNYGIVTESNNTAPGTATPTAVPAGLWVRRSGGTRRPIFEGAGSPEGALAAPIGSMVLRTDGGAATTLYVKESGTGTAGWVAK